MDPATDNQPWTISALDTDPRHADRVLVTLTPGTGQEGLVGARSLALHIAVVADNGLRTGKVLTAAEVAALGSADAFQQTVNRALDFLAVRPRSAWEVRERLRRKGVEAEDIERVLVRLERAGYINDLDFARFWLRERARANPRGPRLLAQELRRKGVHGMIITQALDEAAAAQEAEHAARLEATAADETQLDSEEEDEDPQYAEVLALARRKHRAYASLDPATYRRRMSGFLLRRGYGYGVVGRVLKALQDE